jgi:uncharacterized protein (DUF2141 family)
MRSRLFFLVLIFCFLLGALLTAQNLSAQSSRTGTIRGRLLAPEDGQVILALRTEEDFGKQDIEPQYFLLLELRGPRNSDQKYWLDFEFTNIPYGEYAIASFLDKNENQSLDIGLFGPTEPWGFSNNPRPALRGPNWDEVVIVLNSASISVPMILE